MKTGKKRFFQNAGTPPGTLLKPDSITQESVTLIKYSKNIFSEEQIDDIYSLKNITDKDSIHWLNIVNLNDTDKLSYLGEVFGIHQLALEDISTHGQLPKFDEYDNNYFIGFSRILQNKNEVLSHDVSIFCKENLVITFIEFPENPFPLLTERLKSASGKHRKYGAEYLVYSILDFLIDEFFPILNYLGEKIEDIETTVIGSPGKQTLQEIHKYKRDLLVLRRTIWPMREVVNRIIRDEKEFFGDGVQPYLKDCFDHVFQIMDIVETYRELLSNMVDIYLSSVSNKLNEVMKVLTLIATIFIPLSFIASLYGMNFKTELSPFNMPELNWYFGYPFALSIMVIMTAGLLYYFKKKGWFKD